MPAKPWRPLHAAGYGLAAMILLTLSSFTITLMVGRHLTFFDVGLSMSTALILLLVLALLGRIIAAFPRPYEEWLTLDIVE